MWIFTIYSFCLSLPQLEQQSSLIQPRRIQRCTMGKCLLACFSDPAFFAVQHAVNTQTNTEVCVCVRARTHAHAVSFSSLPAIFLCFLSLKPFVFLFVVLPPCLFFTSLSFLAPYLQFVCKTSSVGELTKHYQWYQNNNDQYFARPAWKDKVQDLYCYFGDSD